MPTLSGSLNITGSLIVNTITASFISGSITNAITASYALNATTASYAVSSPSASYAANSTSASNALTASYVNPLNQNVSITGSLTVSQNLTVIGTSSFTYTTSSIVQVGSNTIQLNTNNPSARFGGITVIDSGSFGTSSTGSLFWDSANNKWIYSNPSGSSYDGGMLISGPRNTSGLGNEAGMVENFVAVGQGTDHIQAGTIYNSGSTTQITGSLLIDSSGTGYDLSVGSNKLFVSASGNVGIGTTTPNAKLHISGNLQVDSAITLGYTGDSNYIGSREVNQTLDIGGTNYITLSTYTDNWYERIKISNSGNVGIGTSTPLDKLSISGDISMTYGNTFRARGFAYSKLLETGYDGTFNQDFLKIYTAGEGTGNANPQITVLRDTGVGIGTTTPNAKLDINGNTIITGSLNNGSSNKSSGLYSHAEGWFTTSNGYSSHAEGNTTTASGDFSHSEGLTTVANGYSSHAEGNNTTASGNYSHAEGFNTVASGHFQHVQGQFNVSSSTSAAFIVGNGADPSTRSNLIFAAGTTVQITGSLNIKDILTLSPRTTTPSPTEGMIIASGSAGSSKLYYYNGTSWNALF